jgi:glycosyltransferase 2 family protein
MLNRQIKFWLNAIGSLLGLAGVVFVITEIYRYAEQIALSTINANDFAILGILVVANIAANIALACSWWSLLKGFNIAVQWKWALKVYGLSQIAKYVPGNIFHLASRQSMGMVADLRALPLMKSTVFELITLSLSALLFGVLILPLFFTKFTIWMSLTLFVIAMGVLSVAFYLKYSKSFIFAFSLHTLFHTISGTLFVVILTVVSKKIIIFKDFPSLSGAYVLAWLAGFVVPGAPAGLGVREIALFFLVQNKIFASDLLLAIVLCRLVTVISDLLFFVVAVICRH